MASKRISSTMTPYTKTGDLFAQAQALFSPAYTENIVQGVQKGLKQGEQRAIASGLQNLSAAGAANTSLVGNLSSQYQEAVAAPLLAQVSSEAEATRRSKLAEILLSQAQFESSQIPQRTGTSYSSGAPKMSMLEQFNQIYNQSPSAQPQTTTTLPKLNLRLPTSTQQTATPQFTQAFIGDPNVYSTTGKKIGTRLTGTYDLATGQLSQQTPQGKEQLLAESLLRD